MFPEETPLDRWVGRAMRALGFSAFVVACVAPIIYPSVGHAYLILFTATIIGLPVIALIHWVWNG